MCLTNLFQQYTGGGPDSLVTAMVAIIMTLIIVYSFKIFVLKSQDSFQKNFEKAGYSFSIEWDFPEGVIKIDPVKEVLWVSTHGNKLIPVKEIDELLMIRGTFEMISIYIKTKKGEVLKYPMASSRKKSKRMSTDLMNEITNKFEDIKKYILEGKEPELAVYPLQDETLQMETSSETSSASNELNKTTSIPTKEPVKEEE